MAINYLHEVVVDQVDDLQMPGQDVAQHVGWPTLKGLRQDGVVGVGAAASRDVPSLQECTGFWLQVPFIGSLVQASP